MITMVPVAQRNVSSPFGFIMRRALISFEVRMGPDLLDYLCMFFSYLSSFPIELLDLLVPKDTTITIIQTLNLAVYGYIPISEPLAPYHRRTQGMFPSSCRSLPIFSIFYSSRLQTLPSNHHLKSLKGKTWALPPRMISSFVVFFHSVVLSSSDPTKHGIIAPSY